MVRSTFSKAAPVSENSGKPLGAHSRVPPVQTRLPGNQALLRLQQSRKRAGTETMPVMGISNDQMERKKVSPADRVMNRTGGGASGTAPSMKREGKAGDAPSCRRCGKQILLQKKLAISQPGDAFEQEADRCAGCARDRSGLQRKLAIGASNDPLEHEADRVADQVMAASAYSLVSGAPPRIAPRGEAIESIGPAPTNVDRVLAGSGRPLEPTLRHDMEQRFGHDFSRVRVHTDAVAAQSARGVNALAYTVGRDVVFGSGQYQPNTTEGRRLLAHELTHVVQQSVGAVGAVVAGTLQRQQRAITSARIEELRQLARNPRNFASGGRNSWQGLSAAEKGAVMMAMDQYYGVPFTTAFVHFASTDRLVTGGINFSRGGVLGEAILDWTDRSLWRTPRFPPMYPECLTLVYPNGSEFTRCAPAPAATVQAIPGTAVQQVGHAVDEARRLQAAGNLQQAITVLERERSAMEYLERDAAIRAGLDPSVSDPEEVVDYIVGLSMFGVSVTLPPEVVDWRTVYNELGTAGRGSPTDEEWVNDLLQHNLPPATP